MMEGWIKVHRKMLDWEWYDDPHTKAVFLEFVLNASLKDKKWKGVLIKRGQLIIGRKSLSKKLGVSEQSIRTSITRLKSTNEITSKSTNKFTIITVVNYDKYQVSITKSTSKSTSTLTNNQPATNHILRSKEVKKEEGKRTSLQTITEKDLKEIATQYGISTQDVRSVKEAMLLWFEEVPSRRRGRNYKATLMNWIRKDKESGKFKKKAGNLDNLYKRKHYDFTRENYESDIFGN